MTKEGTLGRRRPSKIIRRVRRALMLAGDTIGFAHRRLIGYAKIYAIYRRKRRSTDDYLLVSPALPDRRYTLWKLAMLSGLRMVTPEQAKALTRGRALAHFWHRDETWQEAGLPDAINGRCLDISKSYIDGVFGEIFGYATKLDPTLSDGVAVMKPEENCAGTGVIIECPVPAGEVESGYIYQALVDNVVEDGVVREYRVSLMFGGITEVVVQDRSVDRRLIGRGGGGSVGAETKRADEVFSPDELERIYEFCQRIGLEFGELDILPSPSDGRIYILDANTTPTILVRGNAFRAERIKALEARAEMFHQLLLALNGQGGADGASGEDASLPATEAQKSSGAPGGLQTAACRTMPGVF